MHMLEGPTLNIWVLFIPNGGPRSFAGKCVQSIAMDKATMNPGWVSGDSTEISDKENGVTFTRILPYFGNVARAPVTFARRQDYFEKKWFVLLLLLFCLRPNSLWQPFSIPIPQVNDGLSKKSKVKSSGLKTLKNLAIFPK